MSTGRTCDGYDLAFRPRTGSPVRNANPQLHTQSTLVRATSPAYLAPAIRFATPEERNSFEFFTSHAVHSLRGFIDSPFWQREILQAAHRDTAIQHCVVALGAMYRRFFEGNRSHIHREDMANCYLQFALRQSNQAIRDLLRKQGSSGKMTKADRMTLMICSVLFSSMSCLQGYQKDAFEHLKSGIRLLNEVDAEPNVKVEDHPVNMESLRSVLVSLDMQARAIMSAAHSEDWVSRPEANVMSLLPGAELNMPSLLSMLSYFEWLLSQVYQFFRLAASRSKEDEEDVCLDYLELIRRLDQGIAALDTLSTKVVSGSEEYTQSLTALRLLQCQIEYLLRFPRSDIEAKFCSLKSFYLDRSLLDDSLDVEAHFVKMFELATALLPASASTAPVFTATVGPSAALWLVAMRAPSSCTDMRRRAVNLMLSHPRREGYWDGMVAGQMAQEALEIEQESVRQDLGISTIPFHDLPVPDELRVLIVAIAYSEHDARAGMVNYVNARDMNAGRPGIARWVTW